MTEAEKAQREKLTEFFWPFTHNYVTAMQIASYALRQKTELRAILDAE